MKITTLAAAILAGTALAGTSAQAATSYADFATFSAALSSYMTDDYQNPGYGFAQSDAGMTAVLGQTRYQSTGFTNWNLVVAGGHYCAGCNGSFNLYFDNTSYGDSNGVFGVGLDVIVASGFDAFVTFGDNSTQNFAGLSVGFFGLTSSTGIKSIAFGPNGGQASTGGYLEIDNLTIGSGSGAVPEPASWAMMIGGFALAGAAMRQRKATMRFA